MDIENDAQIGERVRLERERLKWSQQVLADRSDVSRMMIGSYERGTHKPSVSVLITLAQAGADASFLLTGQRSAAGSMLDDGKNKIDRKDTASIVSKAVALTESVLSSVVVVGDAKLRAALLTVAINALQGGGTETSTIAVLSTVANLANAYAKIEMPPL